MRYLGIVRPTGGGFKDEETHRYILNHYNRKEAIIRAYLNYGSTITVPYGTYGWRELNDGTYMQRSYFLADEYKEFMSHGSLAWSSYNANNGSTGYGSMVNILDTTPSGWSYYEIDASNDDLPRNWSSKVSAQKGLNWMTMTEFHSSTNNSNYFFPCI